LKICFATYTGVTVTSGGPFIKINDLKVHLEKKGIEVGLFNLWEANKDFKDYDLFHVFGGNFAVYDLCRHLIANNVKYVVNPIIYSKRSVTAVKMMSEADKIFKKILNGIRFDYGFTREICEWSDLVLPNTLAEADLLEKGLSVSKRKIRIIHNGVSEKFLNGDPKLFKQKYGIENFILYVGHLGPARKNGLALLKALQLTDHPAVIIGKISSTEEGEKIKEELKVNSKIVFIDGLDNDSDLLRSAYAACDTFVLPSLFETPGRAALEAALAGAKIVITPNGGTKDYFKDMAEYVNPLSIDSIKTGINKMLNKSKDGKLKEYVMQNFLWHKIADETINVYNEVLKR
jgi:glycosyltransferase involved in cell wall biosynthesis